MKKLLYICTILAFGTSMFGQDNAIEKYFEKYMDDDAFSMVYVSPKMFEMAAKVLDDQEHQDIKDVVKDLRGLRILRTEDKSGAFYKEAKKKINTKEYEILITARDEGQNIEFLTKENGDIIEELLLMIGGNEEEFILMSFVGNIDLNKIARLAKSLDIEGAEYLKELESN